jgi:hypothetical protein
MPRVLSSAYHKKIFCVDFFFGKGNLYADGFAYAEGRATPMAIVTPPREVVAEELCRGLTSA